MPLALLDTDTLSEIFKRKSQVVQQHAISYLAQNGRFTISAITRYEILRGLKSRNAAAQLSASLTFFQNVQVLAVTDAVLDRASDLWAVAKNGGFPRNDADLIIAATALEHDGVLVTGNKLHFDWVPGLTIDDWRQP